MTSNKFQDTTSPRHSDSGDDFGDSPVSGGSLKVKRLLLDMLGRWHWVFLCLILGVLGAAYYLSKAPKRYSATATLLIKQDTATVMSKDQVEEIDMRSSEGLNTVAERIRRHDLLERVASRADVRALPGLTQTEVDWTPDMLKNWLARDGRSEASKKDNGDVEVKKPAPEAAVLSGWLGSWMSISIRRGTRLLDISFRHQVPEVAKALADAVAREYLAEISGTQAEGRSSQSQTLLKQSEEARGKLQAAESALATYNRALELHRSLDTQEDLVSKLGRRYLPKHPKMISAQSELEELEKKFLEEFQVAVSATADQAYWKGAVSAIDASRSDPDAHLRVARQLLLARSAVLKGETVSQMSVFNAMLTRLEESNVNRQGEVLSAEISSFARVPGWADWPQPNKIYTSGAGFGFGAGLLLAFLLTRIDNKFHSVAQIEAETGLPVFAAVSEIDVKVIEKAVRSKLKKSAAPEANPLQGLWDPRLLFRAGASSTNFAEMFRILRASVSLLGDESRRKITLFSSALPGEGKSLVSGNFALAAAAQGRKTLLIDLDLRKPSLHRVFGVTRSKMGKGAAELLACNATLDEVITRDIGCENLHVIFSGGKVPNPGELLNIRRLKELLAELTGLYDLIVLDSAPLLAVPDSRVLAGLADNFCLVVRARYVPKGAVARTLELLSSADTPASGIVFNCYSESRRMIGQNYSYGGYRMSRYGRPYQYGYGSYGSYGADGEDDEDEKVEIARRQKKLKARK
jgi:capsular exopolysaccharide synthesis family protein